MRLKPVIPEDRTQNPGCIPYSLEQQAFSWMELRLLQLENYRQASTGISLWIHFHVFLPQMSSSSKNGQLFHSILWQDTLNSLSPHPQMIFALSLCMLSWCNRICSMVVELFSLLPFYIPSSVLDRHHISTGWEDELNNKFAYQLTALMTVSGHPLCRPSWCNRISSTVVELHSLLPFYIHCPVLNRHHISSRWQDKLNKKSAYPVTVWRTFSGLLCIPFWCNKISSMAVWLFSLLSFYIHLAVLDRHYILNQP